MRLLGKPRTRHRPRAPQPGLVSQVGRLSETVVDFARCYLCETETAIAFAGEKWVFLVQFSGAEVMRVSMSPCCRASCATFFALLGLMVGVSAKKLAQHTKNGSKWVFDGALGELFRGNAAGGAVRGEFFRGLAAAGPRRVPPLVACDGRAVSTEKSPQNQHVLSYNPPITPNTGPLPRQGNRQIRNPRASKEARGSCAETAGFEPARGYAPLPP